MPVVRTHPSQDRSRKAESPAASERGPAHPAWIAAALFAATMAMFWPSLGHDFIDRYDDNLYVTGNARVQQGLNASNIYHAFTAPMASNWHPLTMLSHMLDVNIHGLDPGGHHLTNIVIHSVATVLLFLMLLALTKSRWPSATVALLFALHPMHVESVAWIAERKDVLSATFWFLTTFFYVRYTENRCARRYWPVAVCFALGIMSKPMVVTLPFTLLLLDYWPLNRISIASARDLFSRTARALVTEKLPLFALAFAGAAITYLVQSTAGATATGDTLPLATRIANGIVSYAAYVHKTIWLADYAVFYPHTREMPPAIRLAGSALLLALITAGALWQARRRPCLIVGWFWFLGTLVPVIGIVQVGLQAMADRYSYIPSIGLFVMLVWGLFPMITRALGRPVTIACAIMILLSISVSMRLQLGYWRDSETLFRHALSVTESNFTSNYALGASLSAQGRYDEAEVYLAEAVRLSPETVQALRALGEARLAQGKLPEAYAAFAEIERLDPGKGYPSYHLGVILEGLGRPAEAAEMFRKAIAEYRGILEKTPDDPTTLANLAVALDRTGQPGEALSLLERARELNPGIIAPEQFEVIRKRATGG